MNLGMGLFGQRSLLVAAAGLAMVTLAGCKTAYVADVRNDSGEPIYAQLIRAGGAGRNVPVSQERIAPGDRKGVAKYEVPDDWALYLSVDSVGNPGYPQEFNLTPGTTIVTVTRDTNGRLRLDAMPRP